MRALHRVLLVLGAAALLAGPFPGGASGQDAPRRGEKDRLPGGPGIGLAGPGLLFNKSVQEELKLTDEQLNKLRKAAQEVRAEHKEEFAELAQIKDRRERFEKWQQLMKEVTAETKRAAADVLNDEQERRFRQIQRQQLGILAFAEPEVQKALNLSEEQKEKLKDIGQEAAEDFREVLQKAQGNREEAMGKLAELRKESTRKALGVLDDTQKRTWRELTGEPFQIKFERQPGLRPERDREKEGDK